MLLRPDRLFLHLFSDEVCVRRAALPGFHDLLKRILEHHREACRSRRRGCRARGSVNRRIRRRDSRARPGRLLVPTRRALRRVRRTMTHGRRLLGVRPRLVQPAGLV